MLAAKRLACVSPEVNLREHVTHTPLPSWNKTAHSGFETQRRRHQKSKTGVSVAPQKGLMSLQKFFLKKNKNFLQLRLREVNMRTELWRMFVLYFVKLITSIYYRLWRTWLLPIRCRLSRSVWRHSSTESRPCWRSTSARKPSGSVTLETGTCR